MFSTILLSVYATGSMYLFVRGWQSLEILKRQRIWFVAAYFVMALPLLFVRGLRVNVFSEGFDNVLHIAGYIWLAVLLYGFIFLLIIDILRIFRRIVGFKPKFIYRNYLRTKFVLFCAVCFLISAIVGAGCINAQFPRTTHLTIHLDKQAGQMEALRIAMVSDIHLGRIYRRKMLSRIVKNTIITHDPDIVFLVGDIFDGAPEPVIKNNMGVEFDRLQTIYGKFIAAGNHERIGQRGQQNPENPIGTGLTYLSKHGIKPLLDTTVLIDNSFYVVARKDRSMHPRKTIPELLKDVDRQLPIILLDHQPYHLEEAEHAAIDLQLSGHTHHGQLFPLNYITDKIYEKDWGFLQEGKTYYYISCGAGTWGPPVRTAGYSEVVVIDLVFKR